MVATELPLAVRATDCWLTMVVETGELLDNDVGHHHHEPRADDIPFRTRGGFNGPLDIPDRGKRRNINNNLMQFSQMLEQWPSQSVT